MKRLFYSFLAAFFMFLPLAGGSAQQKFALVIGNAEYQRIDKLKNTVNDAQDIGAALQSLGYQVDLKLNLGHLQMVDAIEAFTTKLAGNRANEGFFWYAGHAVQIQDENYLLPVDITIDTVSRVRAGSFSLNNLIEMLDNAKNKVNVLILDACRDNPLPAAGRGGGGRGLAMVRDVPSDLFVMFSTAPGDKADDGAAGKRNSPFAEAFLKYIKSNEPVYQMAIDVTQETLKLTGQRQRPFQRGSIISEKYYSLNPQAGKSASQPVVQPAPQPAPQPSVTGGSVTVESEIAGEIFIDGQATGRRIKAGGTETISNVSTGSTEVAVKDSDGTFIKASAVMVRQGQTVTALIELALPQVPAIENAGGMGAATPVPDAPPSPAQNSDEVISTSSGWKTNKDNSSSSTMSIDKEQIDGRERDVMTVNVNLAGGNPKWAGVYMENWNIIQKIRNANGVRFKVLGDGKRWRIYFATNAVTDNAFHGITFTTQNGKISGIDVPFGKMNQPDWGKKTAFNKNNITKLTIERQNELGGTGASTIKIFDFEVY